MSDELRAAAERILEKPGRFSYESQQDTIMVARAYLASEQASRPVALALAGAGIGGSEMNIKLEIRKQLRARIKAHLAEKRTLQDMLAIRGPEVIQAWLGPYTLRGWRNGWGCRMRICLTC